MVRNGAAVPSEPRCWSISAALPVTCADHSPPPPVQPSDRQEEMMLAIDSHTQGLAAASAALSAERETAEAIHQLEVLSLEGSGRGRGLLRPF